MAANPVPSPATRAALYVRVSTGKQAEKGYSLPEQLEACREHAAERGYTVVTVYQETHTAVDLYERPELTRCREAMTRREFDVLVCFDPDRFSRKQVHTALLLDYCERAGATLEFANFDFETSPEGVLILNVKAYAAEVEHEKIRTRTMTGKRGRAKSGKISVGPKPLYGYRWNEGRTALVVDEATAPVVRRIFRDVIAGSSLRKLAGALHRDGIPSPTGGADWSHSTLRDLLRHPFYTGKAVAFRVDSTKATRKEHGRRVERPAEEQIALPDGTVPALVTAEEAELARQRLPLHRVESTRNNRNPEAFLLRGGYVRCGACGHVVSTRWHRHATHPDDVAYDRAVYHVQRRSPSHYDCPMAQIEAKILDGDVWRHVEQILLYPENVKAELARLIEDDPTAGDIAALDRRAKQLERQRDNLMRSVAQTDDEDVRALILGQLADVTRQLRQIAEERDGLAARRAEWEAAQRRLGDLESWLDDVAANMPRLTYGDKRDVLAALDVRVVLHPTSHTPRYEIYAAINPDAEPLPAGIVDGTSGSAASCSRPSRCRGGTRRR